MNHEQQHAALSQLHNSNQERLRSTERRRPYVEALLNSDDRPTNRLSPPTPSSLNPSNLVRTRRRAFRPSERLTRSQRDRLHSGGMIHAPSFSTPPPHHPPPSHYAETVVREYAAEAQANRESRYRAKRRKLEDGSYEDESKALTYGFRGQVIPGPLKLDIDYCDGGEYSDPQVPTSSSPQNLPQNILMDDISVYCTKSNRCNILLKHASGMPFSLTKMVVRAPRSGYDAPIQEGMIFVALDDESLLEKTARYDIHYSPKSYRYHRLRPEPPRAVHHEYMTTARSPLQSIDRSRYLRDPREPHRSRYYDHEPTLDPVTISGFSVTTGDPSDDEEQTNEGPSSPRGWEPDTDYSFRSYADRYRPVYTDGERPLGYEYSAPTSDSEDGETGTLHDLLHPAGRPAREDSPDPGAATDDQGAPSDLRRYRSRRSTPSRIGLRPYTHISASDHINPHGYERLGSDPEPASKFVTDSAVATSSTNASDTLAPHARFFIPPHKSNVAIKFDPPV